MKMLLYILLRLQCLSLFLSCCGADGSTASEFSPESRGDSSSPVLDLEDILEDDSECLANPDQEMCALSALQVRALRSQSAHPASAMAAAEEEEEEQKEHAKQSSDPARHLQAAGATNAGGTASSSAVLDSAAAALAGKASVDSIDAKEAPDTATSTNEVGEPAAAADAAAASASTSPASSAAGSSTYSSTSSSSGAATATSASAFPGGAAKARKPINRRFFMWISDVHSDPFYGVEGSSQKQFGVCNRKVNGSRTQNFSKSDAAARPMGAYGCDPPLALWESALIAASQQSSGAEFAVFTGDFVRHKQDQLLHPTANVTNIIGETGQLLVDNFLELSADKLVIGTLGNDDSPRDYEINITNMSEPNPWLEKVAARLQRVGAVGAERQEEYEFGGYFAAKEGGLTILSIDTLMYAKKHKPALPFHNDPFGQFRWLRQKLQEAHDNDEHVWIVGHIPPGVETYGFTALWYDVYLGTYLDIVQDAILGSVVKAQLFGHVHADEVRVLPLAPSEAGPVLLIGAVSPIFYSNPSFRVVEYDENSGELLNFKVFWANLSTSYGSGQLDWQFGYDLIGSYPSLREAGESSETGVLNSGMVKFAKALESSWKSNSTSEWAHYVDWYKTRVSNDLMSISTHEAQKADSIPELSAKAKSRVARKYFCALNISSWDAFRSCTGQKDDVDGGLGSTSVDAGNDDDDDDPFLESDLARARHWHSVGMPEDALAIKHLVRPEVEIF